MPLKTIYIVRHGYRANWLPLPHAPSPTGIDSDPALAPRGVDQANELAGHLSLLSDAERPQLIILSPFYRCVETARPIAHALGIQVTLERGVGEWYKKDRLVIPQPADYKDLSVFFGDVLVSLDRWPRDTSLNVIPDLTGESEEDILVRARLVCDRLAPALAQSFPNVNRILIVTHAATKIALGLALLQLPHVRSELLDGSFLRAGACSLSIYYAPQDSGPWVLGGNGQCSFLSLGEEMNWTFNSPYEAGSDEDLKARYLSVPGSAVESTTLNQEFQVC